MWERVKEERRIYFEIQEENVERHLVEKLKKKVNMTKKKEL